MDENKREDKPLYRVETEMSFTDFQSFNFRVQGRVILFLMVLSAVAFAALAIVEMVQKVYVIGAVFLVLMVLYPIIIQKVFIKRTRKVYESPAVQRETRTVYLFYKDHVEGRTAHELHDMPYKKIIRILKKEKHYYFIEEGGDAFVLPAEEVGKDLEAFLSTLGKKGEGPSGKRGRRKHS